MVLGLVLVMTVPSIEKFLVGSYSLDAVSESQASKQGIFISATAYNMTEYIVTEKNATTGLYDVT